MSKLILSIPKETQEDETRVALTPKHVRGLTGLFKEIRVQDGAGSRAGFTNGDFRRAGARIVSKLGRLLGGTDIVLQVKRPDPRMEKEHVKLYPEKAAVVGFLDPQVVNTAHLGAYAKFGVTGFSFELMPQTLQTQAMHATAAMSRVTGEVVIAEAAGHFGDLKGKNVLVIGLGNAGLAAVKHAKSLGANVNALSTSTTHKAELETLGITFELLQDERGKTISAADALNLQRNRIAEFLATQVQDVIVCAARRVDPQTTPLLITEDMQTEIIPGTLVYDLTKSSGVGNFEGGEYGEDSTIGNGILFRSKKGYPKAVPEVASPLYAACASKFLRALLAWKPAKERTEAILKTCVTAGGLINPVCTGRVPANQFNTAALLTLHELRERARA